MIDRRSGEDRRRGRPPRADVASSRRREFLLTPAEDELLERVSEDLGIPVATIVRDAVNEYVADYSERRVFPISSGNKSSAPLT